MTTVRLCSLAAVTAVSSSDITYRCDPYGGERGVCQKCGMGENDTGTAAGCIYTESTCNDKCINLPGSCQSDWDCSLAGICKLGQCECDAWAAGADCSYINLQPVDKQRIGYVDPNSSSWGGNMVYSQHDERWHMYVAEIACTPEQVAAGERRCGLGNWARYSQVAEAVSEFPDGPYRRERLILGTEHHNPTLQIDPTDGSWNLYSISSGGGPIIINTSSDNGVSWTGSHLTTPVMKGNNPGPYFFSNGTLRMFHRHSAAMIGPTCSTEAIGAVNCDNKTHCNSASDAALFESAFNHAAEDPSVFVDQRGNFHMLVNALPGRCQSKSNQGGHAWSRDGIVWSDVRVGTYNTSVLFTDGDSMICGRRERPQMILDDAGAPLAMSSGISSCPVINGTAWPGNRGDSFTLVQLVGRSNSLVV